MFKLRQCLDCNNLRLNRVNTIAVCSNCGCRFDEKAIDNVLKEFACSNLTIALNKARKNNSLKQKLNKIGIY